MRNDDLEIQFHDSTRRPVAPRQSPPTPTPLGRRNDGSPKTSGMAIAGLVLALLGLTAPIGLILGIVALIQIGNNPRRLSGSGLAIAAIVIGAIVSLVLIVVAVPAAWVALGTGVNSTVDDVQNTLP